MMHVGIFPQWGCQLHCEYCSIRNSKIDRTVKPVPWQKWAETMPRVVSAGSIIDVAGGEPLLYAGIVELLHSFGSHALRWAVTTNAKATAIIKRICDEKPSGCVCFNVSDHSGNPEARENKIRLRQAGYYVNVHRVSHPAAGHFQPDAMPITYQDWKGGKAVDGIARRCNAGVQHWVADPQGNLWRCIVAMETGQPSNGNLFTGKVEPIPALCTFGCSACYTEDPASWGVQMEAA